ncbi:hypothetical protein FACS1894152_2630 [Bacilli bacterium]|nr:hypothetical protein FACS1894152_2630 [Bacilli bacterium]
MEYNNKTKSAEKNYRMRVKEQIDKNNSIIGLIPLPKDIVDPDPVVHMSDLKTALEPFVTKSDLKKALEPFVTRNELKEMILEIKNYIDKALEKLEQKFDEKLNEKLANVATKDDIAAINKRLDAHDQLFRDHGWL